MKKEEFLIQQKQAISAAIRNEMKEQKLSLRKLGDKIGMSHVQINRLLNGKNYTMNNLEDILLGLGLEIKINVRTNGGGNCSI